MAVRAAPIGPFGGPDGDHWDDGAEHTGVRGISLTYREALGSFRVVYEVNRNPVLGEPHPSGDSSYRPVHIYFSPGERIRQVSGHTGGNIPAVRSITVTTDRNIYGPFGIEEGNLFRHDVHNDVFISGFFGNTSRDYLTSIGFYQAGP